MEKEIAKYGYVMIAALVVSSFFNYLYQVVMGILLPKREFGILGVALAIFYIASVLTQNTFSWSGTRRMASSRAEEVVKVFRTTIAGNSALAVFASAAILYYSLGSKTYLVPNLLVAVALLLSAFVNSYVSLLRAMKKFAQLAGANVLVSSLKLLFATLLVAIGFGAVGAIAGLLISMAVALIYLAYQSAKIKLPRLGGFVWDMIPETFYVSAIFLGIAFVVNSSIVFMRWFGGSDVLAGDYNAALTIARGPFFITAALITVLFPYVSSHSNAKREEYAFQLAKYVLLFVFPICISMAADPETWLNLFFGKKYVGGAEILRLLSVGIAFVSLAFVIASNLVAFEKPKVPAVSLLAASLFQVAVVFLGGDPVKASAFSVIASSAFVAVLLVAYYVGNFYFKASLGHALKLIAAYALLSATFLIIRVDGRLLSLAEIAASFTFYFILLSLLGLFDERDVEIVFSPLPRKSVEGIKSVVSKLNGIGR